MAETKRLPQLEGLRGIAILIVFIYHVVNVPYFWSGVDLFFVLSGYLITGVLFRLKQKHATESLGFAWRDFYLRRARRILPPYVLFLVTATFVLSLSWSGVWYWYAFFSANMANLLNIVPSRALVPVWSLAVEEQFYFVWPFVVFLGSAAATRRIALALIVGVPLLRFIFTPYVSQSAIYLLTPFRVDTLACGAFVAASESIDRNWMRANAGRALRWAVAAGLAIAGFSGLPGFRMSANSLLFNTLGYSFIAILYAASLVYATAQTNGLAYRILCNTFLRYMGLISFTFYLFHEGVLLLVRKQVGSNFAAGLITFAVTAVLASISWRFLEAPILGAPRALQDYERSA